MKMSPALSIVIPVFNEQENLLPLTQELTGVLEGLGVTYEVIFVDDGSRDGSLEVLRTLKERQPQLRVIGLTRNCGQTAAFDAGFRAACGRIIITMDADMQNDPNDFPKLLDRIGDWDLVCGWRQERNDTFVRRASSLIANAIRNALSGENIRDTGCSLKAFKSEYAKGLSLYSGMHRFFPTLVKMRGGRVVEVPVHHRPRTHGLTKYSMRNRMVRSFVDLLAVCWMKRRCLRYEAEELK
jgi:glycosyltransferase involved in cell wall biosynthesis